MRLIVASIVGMPADPCRVRSSIWAGASPQNHSSKVEIRSRRNSHDSVNAIADPSGQVAPDDPGQLATRLGRHHLGVGRPRAARQHVASGEPGAILTDFREVAPPATGADWAPRAGPSEVGDQVAERLQ